MAKELKIPKVPKGMERTWIRCRDCGRAYYYDYVPFSLSSALVIPDCGHSIGRQMYGKWGWAQTITAEEAMRIMTDPLRRGRKVRRKSKRTRAAGRRGRER